MATPCGSMYHHGFQRVGAPFHTLLCDQAGMVYPSLEYMTSFMCEACMTRAILGCELRKIPDDVGLLLLKRMRMIDIENRWAQGTISRYTYAI